MSDIEHTRHTMKSNQDTKKQLESSFELSYNIKLGNTENQNNLEKVKTKNEYYII